MTCVIRAAAERLARVDGIVAARLRERHASLVPAIAAHVAFNVGGFVVAIVVQIVAVVATGRPLQP